MAVQGKLVPQDANDEPASALLEHIRERRRHLMAEGKIKAPKGGESVIYRGSDGGYYEKRIDAKGKESDPQEIEVPFEIPQSWEWSRLSSVFDLVRGKGIKRNEVYDQGYPCVRYGELYTTYREAILDVASYTTHEVFERSNKIGNDELLATLTGENNVDIGRTVINKAQKVIAYGGDLIALKGNYLYGDFTELCMNSPYINSQRTSAASGNIIVHLSAEKVGNFLIAVPPANEQIRIANQCRRLLERIR